MDPDFEHGLDIFTALREQLGLGLENVKGLIDVLVVDSARKTPTENQARTISLRESAEGVAGTSQKMVAYLLTLPNK